MSDSLHPHGLKHTRLPRPSPTPGACSDSCPLSQWCHPTISSSVISFSFHLQSFPASGSFPTSQPFVSGGQSIGASASASVLPVNIQGWFPLGLTGLFGCPRYSQESSPTPQFESFLILHERGAEWISTLGQHLFASSSREWRQGHWEFVISI